MTDDATRLAALEAESAAKDVLITELQSELARLRPPPPEPARIDGPFVMPSAQQMGRLIEAVLLKYPVLRDNRIDDAEFRHMTASAFRFLSTLPRTPGRLDLRYDLLSWQAYAADTFRAAGKSCSLRGPALHVAAIAAGDIGYLPPRLFPSAGFGVALLGIARGSVPATNAWLRVLEHEFDERLVIEPPNVGTFNPISKVFDLTAPVNISPSGDWQREL
jgi:hypothetical protein